MISIIISSADAAMLKDVTANIAATIGAPYELLAVDNSKGQKGICTVYNEGVKKAKYDLICFIHEDIIIQTQNWGNTLVQTFNDNPDVGLVGVVGGSYKPLAPSIWGGLGINNVYANITQIHKHSDKESYLFYRNPRDKKLENVACVDGVFLASTKKIATEIPFDEVTFTGFHCYDIDFSLAVGQKYKVAVTFELLLTHLSEGSYTRSWMDDNLTLHKKWGDKLPVNVEKFTLKQCVYIEKITFRTFIKQMVKFNYPISAVWQVLQQSKKKYMAMDKMLYWKLHFYILKIYLKKDKGE